MEWEHLKHVPVEDDEGRLVGLVSSRAFLRLVARGLTNHKPETVPIAEIMKTNLVTVSPETPTVEAIAKMREHRVGCLPVVQNERLVGILTEHDFLEVAGKLLEQQLRPS
jgi:CBS domain-containing protein